MKTSIFFLLVHNRGTTTRNKKKETKVYRSSFGQKSKHRKFMAGLFMVESCLNKGLGFSKRDFAAARSR